MCMEDRSSSEVRACSVLSVKDKVNSLGRSDWPEFMQK
jgi:hypothetical protein